MEVRFSWNAKNVHLGVRYIPMGLHRTPKVGLFSCIFRPLYSYRDYFSSSNVRNIFQQCGFVGLSGTKSVEQAHFSWKAFWLSTTWRECYRIVAMFRKIPPKPSIESTCSRTWRENGTWEECNRSSVWFEFSVLMSSFRSDPFVQMQFSPTRSDSFSFIPIRSDSLRFTPIHSDSFLFDPIRPNSFRFVTIHSNSFRFVLIHSDSFRLVPFYSESLQFITIHSNSFRFVSIHYDSFGFVSIHSASIRFVLILSDSSQFVQIHSDSFRLVPIHSDWIRLVPIHSDWIRFIPIHSDWIRFV